MQKYKSIVIATNSLRMIYNYRLKFILELLHSGYKVKYLLSDAQDCEERFSEEVLSFSSSAQSSGVRALVRDIISARSFLARCESSVLIFTVRNILIFGLASLFTKKRLNVAYFAGLGKSMSPEKFRSSRIYRLIWAVILAKYDRVVCLNDRDLKLLQQVHGRVVMFLGEGFDLSQKPALSSRVVTPEYDFGFVGRFTVEKGGRHFIRLAGQYPEKRFVIYGEIDSSLREESRLSNITKAGFVSEKTSMYESFDTLLHLSQLSEGLPFVFFEAVVFQKKILILENETTNLFAKAMGVTPISHDCILQGRIPFEAVSVPRASESLILECSYQKTNKRLLQWL